MNYSSFEKRRQPHFRAKRAPEADGSGAWRLAFLAEAGILLNSSLDYQATLERVVRLAIPILADYCLVDLLDGENVLRIATAHKDPAKEVLLKKTHRRLLTPQNPGVKVLFTGQPELLNEVTDAALQKAATDEEHLRIMRALAPKSWLTVPLVTRDKILGSMMFALSDSGRRYGPDDIALAGEIGRRAGLAIENAHLYRSAQEEIARRRKVEEVLRKEMAFVALLQAVAVASNKAETPEEAMQTGLDRVCAVTQWPVGHVYLSDPGRPGWLIPSGLWHLDDPDRYRTFRRVTDAMSFPYGAGLPGRVLADRKPLWITNVLEDPNFPRAKMAHDIGVRAGFAFPLWVGAEVVGVLEFFSPEVIEPDEALLEVMRHIGTQLGRVIERKRAEEKLKKKTEEAEEASRFKSKLLSIASHEIRTPLNAILGYASLLKDKLTGKPREMDERIYDNARTLLDLINTLLNLHKIETGKIEISRREVNLSRILAEVTAMLKPMAEEKGIVLEGAGDPAVPLLQSDPVKLRQILTNLVANAIKFTERGSVAVRISYHPEAEKILITVSDTGVGISEADLPWIFEPFYQAHPSGMQPHDGTGLGLAIVKQLTEILGGTIEVVSRPGFGSTFTVRIDSRTG